METHKRQAPPPGILDGLFHIPIIRECYEEVCLLLNRNVPWYETDEDTRIKIVVSWSEAKKVDRWLNELRP